MPLHVAGTASEGCWDYFVTSYTPTIGVLLAARKSFYPIRKSDARTVLAAVPRPFKWNPLKETINEIHLLQDILPAELVTNIPSELSTAVNASGSASCAEVLQSISTATIMHLACHGYHDATHPLNSGFVMGDRMLTVQQLMALNLPSAFFAFLSACETARAAQDQPDQAVHLAATMLFTGFKSVIGTMW